MSKVHSEVQRCDRCGVLYEVMRTDPDWKVTYLGDGYDICDSCYDRVVDILKPVERRKAALEYANQEVFQSAT